jgi:alpha-ketoglutarate-dependent taurine dioxygenase
MASDVEETTMSEDVTAESTAAKAPGPFKRRAVSSEAMVEVRPLSTGGGLPLLVESKVEELDLPAWAADRRQLLEEQLLRHGGLLFRGFAMSRPNQLESFIHALSGEALEYRERSSPRTAVEGKIYTSTDYPPELPIFLHNENSYQHRWPLKIFFLCHTPSATGGETPIADCRRVFAAMDAAVRERFVDRGWMVVRNFGDGFGLDWRTVFQTDDKSAVEEHCKASGIDLEWKPGDRLRTRAVRPAVARHPRTGELLWFNHATFFHVSTLEKEIREELLAEFAPEDLPANTYYGDGTDIEPETLEHLRSLYRRETVSFPWRQGDVLLLDNMMVAHGRAPYSGARKILVGMAEPISRDAQPGQAPQDQAARS